MIKSILETLGIAGRLILVILLIVLIVLMPLLTIWSVNILFPAVNIAYTFETWCATIILGVFFRGATSNSNSK